MEICARVYRPRESPLFRLVEQHIEEFLHAYPARFAKAHGPLRSVVERVLRAFLTCGLVEHGFARLWCGTCRTSVLVPFSCRGRSFCPSCEKKKQLLWAEWLREKLLAPVPHRRVVLTMPRLLRPLFRRKRELLGELSQAGAEAVAQATRAGLGEDVRPGIVVSIATAGDLLQWHPHLHILSTDGGFSPDGSFRQMQAWDGAEIMRLFREGLLARLVLRHAISEELPRSTRSLGRHQSLLSAGRGTTPEPSDGWWEGWTHQLWIRGPPRSSRGTSGYPLSYSDTRAS